MKFGRTRTRAGAGEARRGRARTARLTPLAVLAAGALASGCYYFTPNRSVSFQDAVTQGKAVGQVPWFCHSEGLGDAMDHSHPDGLANNAYAGMVKGDLSWADCQKAAEFFDKAWTQARKYPTRGDAKKAGSSQAVQFVPGLGTHDSIPWYTGTGFDPEHPMFLQYDGMADDAKLAGMSWFVINGSDTTPPEGLPGNNDWWHTHSTLCYSAAGTVIGNEITDEQCTSLGGKNQHLPGVWMLHAWIVPGYEDHHDVFAGAYMCVKGTGPVADDDPCHTDFSDPEHSGTGGVTTTTMVDHTNPGVTTTTMMDHSH